MNRRKSLVVLISAASLALAAGTGCRPKKKPSTAPPQKLESPTMEMGERMSALQRQAQSLSGIVHQLPGRDAKSDRQLLAQAFDSTSQSLKMMAGQEPGGALGQQIDIVDKTRDFLRGGDAKVSIEPSVNVGLRATYSALDGIRQHLFSHDQRVAQQVNAFGGKLPELDQVRGPMHSVVAAEVFQSAADAIGTMSNILSAREQQIAQPAYPQAAPQYAPPPAPAPAAAAPVAPALSPAYAPAQPAAPAPGPAAAAPSGPSAAEYQRLQRDYQQLQQQLQQQQQILQQLQQQQQMQQQLLQRSAPPPPSSPPPRVAVPQPAPAPMPPPAPAPAPAPANQNK